MRAALGLRVHSGWAAAVVVAGPLASPAVLDRRRLILADEESLPGSKQPFHSAEEREFSEARQLIASCVSDARRRAREELRSVLREARAEGQVVEACGLLVAAYRSLPDLSTILASHALIHTADGVHFRDALASAAESLSLKVVAIPDREAEVRASTAAGVSAEQLRTRVAGLGKALGPPWTQDQKLATLAALLALGSR